MGHVDKKKDSNKFYKAFEPAICKITANMKVNCDKHGSQFAIIYEGNVYCKACYDEMVERGEV